MGKCPACGQWNTFTETEKITCKKSSYSSSAQPIALKEVKNLSFQREKTGIIGVFTFRLYWDPNVIEFSKAEYIPESEGGMTGIDSGIFDYTWTDETSGSLHTRQFSGTTGSPNNPSAEKNPKLFRAYFYNEVSDTPGTINILLRDGDSDPLCGNDFNPFGSPIPHDLDDSQTNPLPPTLSVRDWMFFW